MVLELFGKRVKKARSEMGLSQFAMAKKMDLGSVVSISNWENGKSFCDAGTIDRLSEFFQKPAYWFFLPEDGEENCEINKTRRNFLAFLIARCPRMLMAVSSCFLLPLRLFLSRDFGPINSRIVEHQIEQGGTRMLIDDALTHAIQEAKLENSKTSLCAYESHSRHFLTQWGGRSLNEIGRLDVQQWITRRRLEVRPATIEHQISFLKRTIQSCPGSRGRRFRPLLFTAEAQEEQQADAVPTRPRREIASRKPLLAGLFLGSFCHPDGSSKARAVQDSSERFDFFRKEGRREARAAGCCRNY